MSKVSDEDVCCDSDVVRSSCESGTPDEKETNECSHSHPC